MMSDSDFNGVADSEVDNYRSKQAATAGWLVAGIPLFISVLQGVGALTSPVYTWPVIGGLANLLFEIEVFRLASLDFLNAPILVISLFFLFFIAWLGLGLSLFRLGSLIKNNVRNLRRVSAFASTVLFVGAFLIIYRDIWFGSLALSSRLLLLAVPLPTLLGIFVAYRLQPKTNSRQLLDKAEARVDRKRTAFLSKLKDELDHRNSDIEAVFGSLVPEINDIDLSEINSEGSASSEPNFWIPTEYLNIQARIDHLRSASMSENEREDAARSVLNERVQPLDPNDEIVEIRNVIGSKLASSIESKYADFELRSQRWDQAYEVVNRDEYRTFHPTVADTEYHRFSTIHIDNIDDIVEEFDSKPSGTIGATIGLYLDIREHFAFIAEDLEEREKTFLEEYNEIERVVTDIEERIRAFEGKTGSRLEDLLLTRELLVDHGSDDMDGIAKIRSQTGDGKLDEAKKQYHDCQFSDANRALKRGGDLSEELRNSIIFVDQLITVVKDQGQQLQIRGIDKAKNPFLEPLLSDEQLQKSIREDYNCEIDVNWTEDVLRMTYDVEQSPQDSAVGGTETAEFPDQSDDINEQRIRSGAEHVLRALVQGELNEGRQSNKQIRIQTDTIPSYYRIPPVFKEVYEFLYRQDDIVLSIELQGHDDDDNEPPPGYLEFELNPETPPDVLKRELLDRYTNRRTAITNPQQ